MLGDDDTTGAFARALDEAVTRRRVSLTWLHGRLEGLGTPVSMATLSYWRSGRSEPQRRTSLEALHHVEDLLDLERGHLVMTLSPLRRPGPPSKRAPLQELSGYDDELTVALHELGFRTAQDEVVEEEAVLTADLDEHGRLARATCRLVAKAVVEGASRAVAVFGQPPDGSGPRPRLRVVSGCREGRTVVAPSGMFVVVELLLHQELARGETAIYELEGGYDGDGPVETEMEYFAETRTPTVAIWVRFDPRHLPAGCTSYSRVDGAETARPARLAGNTAYVRMRAFGPGTLGLRWTWE